MSMGPMAKAPARAVPQEEDEQDLESVHLIFWEDQGGEPLTSTDSRTAHRSWRGVWWAAAVMLALSIVALLATTLCMVYLRPLGPPLVEPMEADVEESISMPGKFTFMGGYNGFAKGLETVGNAGQQIEGATLKLKGVNFTKLFTKAGLLNFTLHFLHLQSLQGLLLWRNNSLLDGNPCPDDEEAFQGLCYQRCDNLTEGRYPFRSSAFSCCMQKPCSFFNTKFSNPLKLCQGFDVGGHDKGIGCPHSPGDCLLNEEFHLGFCYKKCGVLTNGTHIYRSAAETCCKANSYLECLEPSNIITARHFSVGGGLGDELLEEVAGNVHPPIQALTEFHPNGSAFHHFPALPKDLAEELVAAAVAS